MHNNYMTEICDFIVGEYGFVVDDIKPTKRDTWFFMHKQHQVSEIQTALSRCGVDYTLNADRFAYYCYHSFFKYMTEYLNAILSVQSEERKNGFIDSINDYFNSWIFTQLAQADKII